ncbi:carboxypeptidase-like regulatory domain-containing protein [Pedobacter gandavensis]|uniref:Carboxypeptidase regulatory-like domain-containing protein n=1 Tax=Pedobacter gandavensis TaxID=2679963 RepID=A0ABR6EWM7_9SPHI|nr:carboxypeptidase-like regulatory domain-containing protein [Pedobacter gandavensis]MBB2149675.1 carboxypeptidase regulatory-like domain-containing protein [Pedobacter gandavensis]
MRLINFVIAFLLLSTTLHFSANAQQDSVVLNNIISKTKKLSDEQPLEKVYLHFDKPYYSVADTIWFKAYLTMEQNIPSQLSKIVYVDVINERDSLVETIKIPTVNSVAAGNIPLTPGTYKQGNYSIKAYTVWMLNFGDQYFFKKSIPIGEAIDKQLITHFNYTNTQTDKNQTINAVIQFKNADNVVLANKVVNWKVVSNYETVSKGKGTTDQSGILKIKIEARKNELITNGELITELSLTEKEILTSNFSLRPVKSDNDLQFFPEGGELVNGLAVRISFKAINAKGLGAALTGTITDNTGNTLSNFSSNALGMGSFYLNTEADKSYKANVTYKDGSSKSYELPKASPSGIITQITNTDPLSFNLKILANDAYFAQNKGKTFFIIGTQGGMVYYAAKTRLATQVNSAKIPKDKFPAGIVQVTLLSETGEPINERLAFNYPSQEILSLKTDLPTYKPRQKVKLSVLPKTPTVPVEGSYSISVTDETKVSVDEDTETTILSSLLLTSDLRGYVEKPNYYFHKTDEKKLADLDLLLLTQGFRRFAMKDILSGKTPPISFLPEQDMRITGTLRDRTGMPVRKGALRLTVPGTGISAEAITSPSGLFAFGNLSIPDSSEVLINAKYSTNGSNLMIMLDGSPLPEVGKNINHIGTADNIDSTLSAYLNNSKKQYSFLRTLKEVKIEGAKVKKPSHADHSTLAGLSSINATVIDGDRLKDCNSLAMCLQTMAMGLTYFENNFYVTRDYQQGNKTPVAIFINGMALDYMALLGVNPKDVESVEIFTKDDLGTINRMYNTNGVLVVNTKKVVKSNMSIADLKKILPKENMLKFSPKGFSKQREFYMPKYINPANTYNFNDLRTTIYWNPKVNINGTAPTVLEYWNADGKGTYKAVIEGVDKFGNISRFVYRYTVK